MLCFLIKYILRTFSLFLCGYVHFSIDMKRTPYGPRHTETCLRVNSDSEGLDQTARMQSDQGLHYPLRESLDTKECLNEEQTILR